MNAQTLNTINVLTTRRNLAARKLAQLGDTLAADVRSQLQTFIIGADARARSLGAKLVTMPGRPGAVIADVFLSMVADD
jgi:4-diphosphocytidyl-2C-methyl-D-erythritol kinase